MIALIVVIHSAVLIWGLRLLRGDKRLWKWLVFAALLGWSTYVHISGFSGVRNVSLSTPYFRFFQPAGQAIIRWLGG
ncbi:hypothetical protein [Paenibacillus macerans]|uniref:hypothetical protein n=1 Tax=Paenibacillus macerans TaxID=44252 RepID=UPI003D314266